MVTLSVKEEKRLMVLNGVAGRRITGRQAAEALGLSLRHTRRLLAAYRKEGAAALAHGNRGRRPSHALGEADKERVLALFRSTYSGCNIQHFSELLSEREGIKLSRSSVRRILRAGGAAGPRRHRPPRHRRRRERYPQEGMLLQIDGSQHGWLQDRGPALVLIGAIDDATGKVPYALFREQEDTWGYFALLRQIVTTQGVPLALYHDGHAVFQRNENEPESLDEQLEGRKHATQFGRVLAELHITSIRSRSPQARGRVERLWGTFQDRLVSELRLAGASTIEAANDVLLAYLPRHNQKFAVSAAQPGSAFRSLDRDPDDLFCLKYTRTVGLDNVIRCGPQPLQVLPDTRYSYARATVEIRQYSDGTLAACYQGHRLHTRPAPPEAPRLRQSTVVPARPKPARHAPPAPNHPWRRWVYRPHLDRG
jgi:transposase